MLEEGIIKKEKKMTEIKNKNLLRVFDKRQIKSGLRYTNIKVSLKYVQFWGKIIFEHEEEIYFFLSFLF